ncbi:transporter substrate-binding domain-containing protein [Streptomyces sp. BE147]|uniref:transporter substrate-binding domain-containing protein n=1 Tax=unclassified Streptomyces TaxID=2593676 RepID=UPI002E76307F|nr:transporter substrate-binding domain-containing protein [Streptomyces sp. BE147]MEE1737157.1 transporter substrate-binding domain-containing protein [Streptomyces sp. BE147]
MALVPAALLALSLSGCGTDSILNDDTRVGSKSDQPGTSYSPHDGEFNGLDITVVNALFRDLGYDSPRPIPVQSKNRTRDLHDGDIHLVAATFSITPKRMQTEGKGGEGLDFVGPYASTQQGVLVAESDTGIQELSDLDGKQVCVWKGTTSDTELSGKAYENIRLRRETDARTCVRALLDGHVSAVSTDQLILYGFMEHYRGRLKVVPEIKFGEPNDYGIAMLKKHRKDCEKLRDALKHYVSGPDWDRDVENNLPQLPKSERDEAHPTEDEISSLSCVDEPKNMPTD